MMDIDVQPRPITIKEQNVHHLFQNSDTLCCYELNSSGVQIERLSFLKHTHTCAHILYEQ